MPGVIERCIDSEMHRFRVRASEVEGLDLLPGRETAVLIVNEDKLLCAEQDRNGE